ncbi:unnamed protein product [Orchesella dallaii]|uniref:Uncharacterized protein n=1 Tax=Orchesella dallaii TaxID=48710 RepID=A0ABP1RF85_9HEXA
MLSGHVVLLVVLAVPFTLAFPTTSTAGNGDLRNMRHYRSHSSAPTDDTRTSRGIEEKQVNHNRESSPNAQTRPITPGLKETLRENERFNKQPGSSNIRNEIDRKATPHFPLSANPKEVVTRKESQIVDSYQKEMEAPIKDNSNGSTLQDSMISPKKLQLYNLDDYYVQEDVDVEDGRSTATLTPDVQSLLQKNKGISWANSKHKHGPTFINKNPKDSAVKLGLENHIAQPTTLSPFIPKPTIKSETKILVNDYVIPVPEEHLSSHGRKDTFGDNISQGTGTNATIQTGSQDIRHQKSKVEMKPTTVQVGKSTSTSKPTTEESNTFGNRHRANEGQQSNNKEDKTDSYGSDTTLDYPMDYLALDDEEYKEKRLSNIANIVKIIEQPNVSSIQITSTDTIKVETGSVSTSNSKEPKAIRKKSKEPQSPIVAHDDEIVSTVLDSSALVINLPPLDTELKLRGKNINTAHFRENSDEGGSSSSSEEAGITNGVPISRMQQTIAGESIPGNNYTNTEPTKIDIYLEIRAPSIAQTKSTSTSSNLEQQGQIFSVPLHERHHYHDHEHNHNMDNDNNKRSSLP